MRERSRRVFKRLQQRLARRGSSAVEAAGRWPAQYVIFGLVHTDAIHMTGWPYERRRASTG
ncbi:hypothetical protein [Streptomyces galbus]|uniref:hypothetical protein n=1 Tax=Streptomyces galbus TaxID=33898 RepID=UPI00144A827F|nr:hypothetical protein [Streptomyces galbus]GHD53765.1 hypothetical protein GCM10010335_67660 [Streptomyces galbus]